MVGCISENDSHATSSQPASAASRLTRGARLVDIKVCAVTDVWSGLKLVIPVKERK
jgi:hypothetical protein